MVQDSMGSASTALGRAGEEQCRGAGVVSLTAPLLVHGAAYLILLWVVLFPPFLLGGCLSVLPWRFIYRFVSFVVPFYFHACGLFTFFLVFVCSVFFHFLLLHLDFFKCHAVFILFSCFFSISFLDKKGGGSTPSRGFVLASVPRLQKEAKRKEEKEEKKKKRNTIKNEHR